MSRVLAILGAGGHGRVVADCAEAAGWDRVVFFDDNPHVALEGAWSVEGSAKDLMARASRFEGVVVGVGANRLRLRLTQELMGAGAHPATLVHPAASVSRYASVEAGSVIFAGAVVNIGARIGRAVVLNTSATVDHDCVIEDGVHVSPGAHLAGGVKVGEASWIGIGAAVRECTVIGADAVIGTGATVIKPVMSGLTMVGNPARPLER